MSRITPGKLMGLCAAFAALFVPLALTIWLRSTNSLLGGITMLGSVEGRPRELAAWLVIAITGLLASLLYMTLAGFALAVTRRLSDQARSSIVLAILPLSLWFVWYRLTG